MAITAAALTERVRRRLLEEGQRLSDTIDADIENAIPAALQTLGIAVAESPDPRYRGYGQAEFSVAIVSGVTAALSSVLLLDHVLRVTHPTQGVMSHAKDFTYLSLEKSPMGGAWYAIEQGKLYSLLDDGVTPCDDDTLVILANQIPTLLNLHVQLDAPLIEVLVSFISGGSAPEESEGGA
jgi:hypothetical protein